MAQPHYDPHVANALATKTSAPAPQTLSERYWGLNWKEILPWQFDDVTVEVGDLSIAGPFVAKHYASIFFRTSDHEFRFFDEAMSPAKGRFLAELDTFVFRREGETVGLVMSHPTDWSTYFMRTAAILPEFRKRGLLTNFLHKLYEPLIAAGVARIEGDISPLNEPMVKLLTAERWATVGTLNSERWGLVLRCTKHLNVDAENTFRTQFSYFPPRRPAETRGSRGTKLD